MADTPPSATRRREVIAECVEALRDLAGYAAKNWSDDEHDGVLLAISELERLKDAAPQVPATVRPGERLDTTTPAVAASALSQSVPMMPSRERLREQIKSDGEEFEPWPCICADPENCTIPVPGYRCRRTRSAIERSLDDGPIIGVPLRELEELSLMAATSTADPTIEELESILDGIGNKVERLIPNSTDSGAKT